MNITRDRYLTPEEAEKYDRVRAQVAEELPELIRRHQERLRMDLLQQAIDLYQSSRTAEAIALLRPEADQHPEDSKLNGYLGALLVNEEEYDDGLMYLDRCDSKKWLAQKARFHALWGLYWRKRNIDLLKRALDIAKEIAATSTDENDKQVALDVEKVYEEQYLDGQ